MRTTPDVLKAWFDSAVAKGSTHLVIVCDTFDHDDYPVFVSASEDVEEVVSHYNGPNMQKVREVYKVSLGWAKQEKGIAWNLK